MKAIENSLDLTNILRIELTFYVLIYVLVK